MIKPTTTLAAIITGLFPKSEKAVSERLEQEEFNAFAGDAQEVQARIDAQAEGNTKLRADLEAQTAEVTRLTAELKAQQAVGDEVTTLKAENTALKAKADQWDAYKASLAGAGMGNDSMNGKKAQGAANADDTQTERLRAVKAKHPRMAAKLTVGDEE